MKGNVEYRNLKINGVLEWLNLSKGHCQSSHKQTKNKWSWIVCWEGSLFPTGGVRAAILESPKH